MSETQHTPTPWKAGTHQDTGGGYDVPVLTADGTDIEIALVTSENTDERATVMADAAFIVQACNAHDSSNKLVEACRAYRTLIITVQERLTQYLCPAGSNDSDEVLNDILGILDGPAWRAVDETGLSALAKLEKEGT